MAMKYVTRTCKSSPPNTLTLISLPHPMCVLLCERMKG